MSVTPLENGIQVKGTGWTIVFAWIPASAGMTGKEANFQSADKYVAA